MTGVTAETKAHRWGPAALAERRDVDAISTAVVLDPRTETRDALDTMLASLIEAGGSDLHLTVDAPPMIRVHGDIKRINMPALTHKEVHGMVYDIMNDKQRKAYEEFFETDFSFEIPKLARFRVNAFNQNRGAGAVFRNIPSAILSLDDLQAPKIFRDLCMLPRGLVLVTGPTGSGKSTTLAGMIGVSRENVNRALAALVSDGAIRQEDGRYVLVDEERLRRFVANDWPRAARRDRRIETTGL